MSAEDSNRSTSKQHQNRPRRIYGRDEKVSNADASGFGAQSAEPSSSSAPRDAIPSSDSASHERHSRGGRGRGGGSESFGASPRGGGGGGGEPLSTDRYTDSGIEGSRGRGKGRRKGSRGGRGGSYRGQERTSNVHSQAPSHQQAVSSKEQGYSTVKKNKNNNKKNNNNNDNNNNTNGNRRGQKKRRSGHSSRNTPLACGSSSASPTLVAPAPSAGAVWVSEPMLMSSTIDEPSRDHTLTVRSSALVNGKRPEVFSPQGAYGEGIAAQMLADAPYFFTDPFAPQQQQQQQKQPPQPQTQGQKQPQTQGQGQGQKQSGAANEALKEKPKPPIETLYNLTHYYAPTSMANRYLLNSVIKPLLDPRCTFHERFSLEVYRQDTCRRFIEEVMSAGYALPPVKPDSSPQDLFAVVLSIRSLLLKSLAPEMTALFGHYSTVRDFSTQALRVPGTCFLKSEKRGRASAKPDEVQQRFIEWLSGRITAMRAAEREYEQSSKSSSESTGKEGAFQDSDASSSKKFNAYIAMKNARSIGLPVMPGDLPVVAGLTEEEGVDNEADEGGSNFTSPATPPPPSALSPEPLSPSPPPSLSPSSTPPPAPPASAVSVEGSLTSPTYLSSPYSAHKHLVRNQVGFHAHYRPDASRGNPIGYRNGTPEGSVYLGQVAKGDLVAVAMKGWFGRHIVLGARNDRRARRDLMRERGELPQIYDPQQQQITGEEVAEGDNPTVGAGTTADSNALDEAGKDNGDNAKSEEQNKMNEEDEDDEPSTTTSTTTNENTPASINIHRKMMYFHTTVIDPTMAVTKPSLPLPKKEINKNDLDSPSAAAAFLRRMRSAECARAMLHSSIVSLCASPQIQEFMKFADRLRECGLDEISRKIKEFDIRLGTVHAKEGVINENRVWMENLPRIIKLVLLDRYGALMVSAFAEQSIICSDDDEAMFGKDHFNAPLQPYESEVAAELMKFYKSAAAAAASSSSSGAPSSSSKVSATTSQQRHQPASTLKAIAFWVTKCQLMHLTDKEMRRVRDDTRFQRLETFLTEEASDSFICRNYRLGSTITPDDILRREEVLDLEAKAMQKRSSQQKERDSHEEGESAQDTSSSAEAPGKSNDVKKAQKLSETAAGLRAGLLKYLAFWIYCDLLNTERGKCVEHRKPLPFFHFVTVNTKYCSNSDPDTWAHVGEFDGLLLDLRLKAPQLLHVFEIKANPADLTSAWRQRERFLSTLWTSFCRRSGDSFVCPLHLSWYSMHGAPRPQKAHAAHRHLAPPMPVKKGDDTVAPTAAASTTPLPNIEPTVVAPHVALRYKQITPGEVSVYPAASSNIVLPPFYQLIFPLLSFNTSGLLAESLSVDDFGRPIPAATTAIDFLRERMVSQPKQNELLPPVHPQLYNRMLSAWIFVSFIIVARDGVPIIPQWRLQGMGSFRHTLCNGAAIVYAAGRQLPTNAAVADGWESWSEAISPTGTIGKILAAKETFEKQNNGGGVGSQTSGKQQVVGPWLRELEQCSPSALLQADRFRLPDKCSFVFSTVFYSAVKYQTSKITKIILCPQELVSELSRNGCLSSLLLIPKFEIESSPQKL